MWGGGTGSGNRAAWRRQGTTAGEDNVVGGPGEIRGGQGEMIDSGGPHVTLIGANNIVVVVDGEDILVTSRNAVQRVGEASRCKNQ